MPTPKVTINVQFRIEEYNALLEAAKARDIPVATLVRQNNREALGLIEIPSTKKKRARQPWEIPDDLPETLDD